MSAHKNFLQISDLWNTPQAMLKSLSDLFDTPNISVLRHIRKRIVRKSFFPREIISEIFP
jgi:hypothetical protein